MCNNNNDNKIIIIIIRIIIIIILFKCQSINVINKYYFIEKNAELLHLKLL